MNKDIKNTKEELKEMKEFSKFLFKAKLWDEDKYVYGSYIYTIGHLTGLNPFSINSSRRFHCILDADHTVWNVDEKTIEQVK